MARGFLLQSGSRVVGGQAVVVLWGRLEDGRSFLVRDRRERPGFFVRREEAELARTLGAIEIDEGRERRAFDDGPVVRVTARAPDEIAPLSARLRERGLRCYEADLRLATRYRIDRGLRSGIAIEGRSEPGTHVDHVFLDPTIGPADVTPDLRVLSLDIETDPSGRCLLSVAIATRDVAEVLLVAPPGRSGADVAGATTFDSERELLPALVRRVRELDPDVLTGWNVVDFDLVALERIGRTRGCPLALGRGPGPVRLVRAERGRATPRAFVDGRLILDGIDLVRGAFLRYESYSLESVARRVLGRGKTIGGRDRAGEILRAWQTDPERLVEYNRVDAQLVLDILAELRLVELAVERSRLTGQPLDRVSASIASFEFLYLSGLSRRGLVGPTADPGHAADVLTEGGHVLEPRPGLYRNVFVLDFRSLYPSIIRTFQIDPLGHATAADTDDPIVAPNGAAFRREPGILPEMLDELFPRRERAAARGDTVAAQAIKILMNSFYGVLGTPACRFASPDLANAITGFGREILLWTRDRIEAAGLAVLYGDTDSLFVRAGTEDASAARSVALELVERLNTELARHVDETWRVTSRLELRFERLFLRLFLPSMRGGAGGARKRYAGLVERPQGSVVSFTGLEVVRSDWTPLARSVQRELYERLFRDQPVDDYLKRVVAELRAGALDDQLVYRRTLRKELEDYTASTPPHVAAARQLGQRAGRVVSYVVTSAGPRPAEEPGAPIDHEHYIDRQLRPVAEPILELLGLEFDRVIGDDRQQRLF
jgi:DNA polymerase-2